MLAEMYLKQLVPMGLSIDKIDFRSGALHLPSGSIFVGVREVLRVKQEGLVIRQTLLFPDDSLVLYNKNQTPQFCVGLLGHDD